MSTAAVTPVGERAVLRLSVSSIVRAVAILAVAAAIGAIALRAVHPLVSFLQAAVIAALARPVVLRLGRWIPQWSAVLAVTALVLLTVGGVAAVGFSEVRSESVRLAAEAPRAAERLQSSEPFGSILTDLRLSDQVREITTQIERSFDLGGADLPGLASAVGGRLSSGFIVWVLAVMLVFAGPAMVRGAVGLVPVTGQARAQRVLTDAHRSTLVYLGLTALRSLVVGGVVFVLAELLQLDLAAVLAVLAGLAAFVPRVGIILGFLPVLIVATLEGGAAVTIAVMSAIGLQSVDALVVQPRINQRSVRVGVLVTVVSIGLGSSLYGVVGVFIGLFVGCFTVAAITHAGDEPGDGTGDEPGDEPLSPVGASHAASEPT